MSFMGDMKYLSLVRFAQNIACEMDMSVPKNVDECKNATEKLEQLSKQLLTQYTNPENVRMIEKISHGNGANMPSWLEYDDH